MPDEATTLASLSNVYFRRSANSKNQIRSSAKSRSQN